MRREETRRDKKSREEMRREEKVRRSLKGIQEERTG